METFKRIIIMLLKKIFISVIFAVIGAVIAYLISKKYDMEFPKVLEYVGFILIVIGLLSVIGNRKILSSYSYNMTKFATDVQRSTFSDIEMKSNSYKFLLITGFAGLMLFLFSLAIWKY